MSWCAEKTSQNGITGTHKQIRLAMVRRNYMEPGCARVRFASPLGGSCVTLTEVDLLRAAAAAGFQTEPLEKAIRLLELVETAAAMSIQ